jgi:hypothetical protein
MRHLIVILTVFYSLLIVSCDGDTKPASKDSKSQTDLVIPINIQKGGDYTSVQEIRNQTKALIDSRIKQNPEAFSMITYGYWLPEFVFNEGKMSKENQYAGYWIDFNEDFSYEYGLYSKTLGKGKYHFRLDDIVLLMLDDNTDLEPKVWGANNNGDVMVLVGKHDFGINNGMQIKMQPSDTKPSK